MLIYAELQQKRVGNMLESGDLVASRKGSFKAFWSLCVALFQKALCLYELQRFLKKHVVLPEIAVSAEK